MRHQSSPGGSNGRSGAGNGENRPESRIAGGWLALAAALALSGCDDRILDTGFGYRYLMGETVPESQRAAPVRRMSDADPDYPSLHTVPDRPPPPPGPAERRQQIERLAADREAARAADEALKAVAPTPPLPPEAAARGGTGAGTPPR